MAQVSVRGVEKAYDGGVMAVRGIDLEVADGEFVVLVGPSGCGKSTTLRMIAGLEEISGGEIWIGGRRVNDVPPRDRDIAMVFQNYALYPHMTVQDNMGFGLKLRGMPKADIKARVDEAARILDIVPLDDTLLMEVQVNPRDIGFLHFGQLAEVKFSAYDFAIYGGLQGKIEQIGANTITDEKGNSFYVV